VKVGRVSIGTILSAGIADVFSGEVASAVDLGGGAAPAAWAQPDPPKRAIGRRWLGVAAAALVTGAYAAQVVVPAAETSPAPIVGIAPSYGPKTVSAVPNALAIVRRIWLPGLDAGYDPQGLAVDGGGIYVSAYRSDSLGGRRGPCRVIRIDLETGAPTGYVDVPSPWFGSTATWVGKALGDILRSEPAQKALGAVADGVTKAAVDSFLK
jgi:hypothetical protein